MNKKGILGLVLAGTMLISAFGFAGCGDAKNPDGESAGGSSMNTYKIEAEYCNLGKVKGAGISSDQHGVDMIIGEATEEQKAMWSEGYYLGFTHTANFSLNFEFDATEAGKGVIKIALGNELPTYDAISLTPEIFEISINGEKVSYGTFSVPKSEQNKMKFKEFLVSGNANIVKGKNIVNVKVNDNDLKNNETGGPMIDYLMVKTSTNITPVQIKSNPGDRGSF